MSEHTPGAWFADVQSTFDSHEQATAWFSRVYAAGQSLEVNGVLAVSSEDGETEIVALTGNGKRAKANARLIAVAPALLAAARDARSLLDRLAGDSELPEDDRPEVLVCRALSAAITRAEGGAL